MKSMLFAAVLFAGGVWAADDVADRAAIENTIRAFSTLPARPAWFTSDFDQEELVRFGKAPAPEDGAMPVTVQGTAGTLVISKAPMGEATWFPAGTHGILTVKKIRFLTPEVAIVDAVERGPVLIVLKKEGTDWKIASLRRLAGKGS